MTDNIVGITKYYLEIETGKNWTVNLQELDTTQVFICKCDNAEWTYIHNKNDLLGIHEFLYQIDLIIKDWKELGCKDE
jgi:hypothetical protein